jgi:hypothetical protein
MGNRVMAFGALTLLLVLVADVSADPVRSGPAAGEKVPGPFRPLHVTGPNAGARLCLYCKYGANPVAVVFARQLTMPVVVLLQKLDAITAAHGDCSMGSYAVFLNESPQMIAALKQAGSQAQIRSTILTVDAGPPSYNLSPDADVTVLLYTHRQVKANYAFRAGELNAQAINAIVADVAKILPPN